jgi:hypothetical protein
MDAKQLEKTISYCGLSCGLCNPAGSCNCKTGNHCGKRLSPYGCYQYNCCKAKNINGCWECDEAPCGKDMLAADKVKIRAFVRCIKEDGIVKFSEYLTKNMKNGIEYHRGGIFGDYDLESEDAVLKLLRTGNSKVE